MQEISNSLRQRLKARPEPQVHPDPDLLTAYTEQALPPAERSQVVQHLAECGYCREIVALSLPEVLPEQAAAQAPKPSRRWIPVYRWAAVAATVAIAAALVIEKPWKTPTSSNHFEQSAATSDSSQKPAVADNVSANASPAQPENRETETKSLASTTQAPQKPASAAPTSVSNGPIAPTPELGDDRPARLREAEHPSGGAGGGAIGGLVNAPQSTPVMASPKPAQPPPVTTVQVQAGLTPTIDQASKDADRDFVNAGILSNQAADASTAGGKLPEAPSPKEEAASQYAAQAARKNAPKISHQNLVASAMDVPVVPPTTTQAEQSAPSPESTLAGSGGFKLKSKVGEAINKTVTTVKKVTRAKSGVPGPFTLATPSSVSTLTDAEETGRTTASRIQWSITPDGRLLRSTDVGQWHEAYPQGPDLQFRVVEPRGHEVWAGGNHGTLIHSWNAGVDWSKLNVPDSATSDITGISIDGENVQVKTSNGQTFVSPDHGKTWVPLQQQPQ